LVATKNVDPTVFFIFKDVTLQAPGLQEVMSFLNERSSADTKIYTPSTKCIHLEALARQDAI
jgi:hypothetical protein